MERDLGERAGLGFVGKNTLLINESIGSGMFLGAIFTTLPLAPPAGDRDGGDEPPAARRRATKQRRSAATGEPGRARGEPGCGACTRCLDACPTAAFRRRAEGEGGDGSEEVDGYWLDARRCISYLTIELKGVIPTELRPLIGTRVYGCDVCQRVCPWNRFAAHDDEARRRGSSSESPLFGAARLDVARPHLFELLALDRAGFDERFAGTAIRRIGLARMLRNAAVALGNCASQPGSGEASRLAAVAALSGVLGRCDGLQDEGEDEVGIVREHAQWALDQWGNDAEPEKECK